MENKYASHHPLFNSLCHIVGSKYVSDDDYVLFTYSRDTGPMPGKIQGIVARPGNTEEVVEIVRLANQTHTPIVASGGRAGLYGVVPGMPGRGIVVDMRRMNKIVMLDKESLCVQVEGGMPLAEFETKLREQGYTTHTAYQPWYVATVGGQISGVAGGGGGSEMTRVGFNLGFINGVKVVLGDGTVVQTGSSGTNARVGVQRPSWSTEVGGPDMTGMFVGDGGTFGIKVEASFRVFKDPLIPKRAVVGQFKTLEDCFKFYNRAMHLEPMPFDCLNVITPYSAATAMYLPEAWYSFTIFGGNFEGEVDGKEEWARKNIAECGGVATDNASAMEMADQLKSGRTWREMGQFASLGRFTLFEVEAPLGDAQRALKLLCELTEDGFKKRGVDVARSEALVPAGPAHVVTIIPFYNDNDPKTREAVLEVFKEYYDVAMSNGWFPDCPHGYATNTIAKYWTPGMYQFMKTLKKATDPNGIMNPGMWGGI